MPRAEPSHPAIWPSSARKARGWVGGGRTRWVRLRRPSPLLPAGQPPSRARARARQIPPPSLPVRALLGHSSSFTNPAAETPPSPPPPLPRPVPVGRPRVGSAGRVRAVPPRHRRARRRYTAIAGGRGDNGGGVSRPGQGGTDDEEVAFGGDGREEQLHLLRHRAARAAHAAPCQKPPFSSPAGPRPLPSSIVASAGSEIGGQVAEPPPPPPHPPSPPSPRLTCSRRRRGHGPK
jgi:hypothetical protein